MADISAIFFILLVIGIAFPAMLTAWWLLFPNLISRAQTRVEKTPWGTFWMGLIVTIALVVPIIILFALPFGPAKFFGWILLGASLTISSIGSAGIAAHLGSRLSNHSNLSPLSGFIRGTVILELAAFFPVIGWLFIWCNRFCFVELDATREGTQGDRYTGKYLNNRTCVTCLPVYVFTVH
jgi:hypothetical protein